MPFSLRPTGFASLFVLLIAFSFTFSACSGKLRVVEESQSEDWLLAGENSQRQHARRFGPAPPFELVDETSFNASIGEYILQFENTVVVATGNGRVHAFDPGKGKRRAKIKLENNIPAHLALTPDGLLLLGIELGRETLQAYDLRQGKYLWKSKAGLIGVAPALTDSAVIAVNRFKSVAAYALQSGERLWKTRLETFLHSPPSVAGDLVLLGADDGHIYALDQQDGTKRWQFKTGAAVFAAPVIADSMVYVASTDGRAYQLNLADGNLRWQVDLPAPARRTPAYANNLLVLACGDGSVVALDASSGKENWRIRLSAPPGTSPLVVDDYVYIGGMDHHFYALSARDGKLLWNQKLRGRVRTNPIVNDDYIIVGSEDKHLYQFKQQEEALAETR